MVARLGQCFGFRLQAPVLGLGVFLVVAFCGTSTGFLIRYQDGEQGLAWWWAGLVRGLSWVWWQMGLHQAGA